MKIILIISSLLTFISLPCSADKDKESIFEQYPSEPPGTRAEPVLQLYVTLTDSIDVGQTDDGQRYIVPITGGFFTGNGISGEVLPGGADWQVVRADGIKKIIALYSIRTTDGEVIIVDNQGISYTDDDGRYRRTIPKFHAPKGKYDWLNKSLFIGTITSIKKPRAVIIRVYEVK
ncbi:MAG: DUF3237 family protein [Gammaproteobacteria bacterium]|nr:DUF3237 family protein [Gammaproteobacteria bacterium]MDE0158088.1 DUF3237 family protein [Gammaproteobacteria bacterium]MDE0513847.1 DUF3237 family protein [Gammaproteobacteria bacterium]